MKTPIFDFVKDYAEKKNVRLHMPGHKGRALLGCEALDITEIDGADSLYSADGIIAESENNATRLFGTAHTFYSTEGSTLSIKTMLALALSGIKKPRVLAARGAHKAFIYAAALLDVDVEWVFPAELSSICSSATVTPEEIERALDSLEDISAVYLTSPDYLGNIADVSAIAKICHKRGILLLVDNAHGAYLNFLSESRHPIALGADMCCDSAHKTLPALTGGAYLHISERCGEYVKNAKNTMSIFASTSPSYLTLISLDLVNSYLECEYREHLAETVKKTALLKESIKKNGISVLDTEPLKIVIDANEYGYTGVDIANCLRSDGIEPEYADTEYTVLMVSTENTDDDLERLVSSLSRLPRRSKILRETAVCFTAPKRVMSVREAMFSLRELVLTKEAVGRICASPTVSCPPAIPIAVSGEVITDKEIKLFEKYKIEKIEVVKNA